MKATTGTRRSLRAPLLIAAFAGLAATASGCIIDSDPPCDPRIFIPWALEIAGTNPPVPITCYEAGVRYIGADVNGYPYEVDCPANFSAGTMTIPVGGAGSYTIVVAALDPARVQVVAPTPALTQNLGTACGTATTPEAVFAIP
jgi:hypothetical protein